MRGFLFTLFLFASMISFAQETKSEYEFFGFSDDLKYVAFETYIPPPVDDVAPFSKIIFVDVAKNDYATKPLNHSGKKGQDTQAVRKENMTIAQPAFATYKITPRKNIGTLIPFATEKDFFNHNVPRDTQTFVIDNIHYTLELHTIDTDEQHPSLMIPKQKFELVIKYNDKTQVLQKDNTIPASRGFVIGYKILSAYHVGQSLAVILEYDNPGFEGSPDTYQMIVTGVLGR
jgi:predicted secreted protein